MNIRKDKFIIVEIIPTNTVENDGIIIQISALKINNLKLQERFDCRLKDEALPFIELKDFINYDNEQFTYVNNSNDLLDLFKTFSQNLPILVLDNLYSPNHLKSLNNTIDFILNYLNMTYNKNIIDQIIDKYHLTPSNHIVDLLYEALLMEY